MTAIHAAVMNLQAHPAFGCDAFAHDAQAGIWVMADGANSCPGAKQAALWVATQIVDVLAQGQLQSDSEFERSVLAVHTQMLSKHPETAATLLIGQICPDCIRLASIGDSLLRAFHQPAWLLSRWREKVAMPRDVDTIGNPTQLIGSEVCETVHMRRLPLGGRWLLVFMTDGAAAAIKSPALVMSLAMLGRQQPSPDDLEYLCRDLALQALAAGCQDDVSVAMVWLAEPVR
jgi:hypothetical protein